MIVIDEFVFFQTDQLRFLKINLFLYLFQKFFYLFYFILII